MNDPKDDYCNHEWDSAALVRVCFLCGQVRSFPSGDENPQVLWPGRGTEDKASLLPQANKAHIAGMARRFGIKKFGVLTGIRMPTLIGWVAFYCRKSPKPRVEKVTPSEIPTASSVPPETEVEPVPLLKKQRHSYFETNREAILNDVRRCGRPEALKMWGIASSTFSYLARRWGVEGIGIMRRKDSVRSDQKEEPQMDIEYQLLKARFDGYRQAVIDMSKGKKDGLLS